MVRLEEVQKKRKGKVGWSSFYTRRSRTEHKAAHIPCGYVVSCCRYRFTGGKSIEGW